METILTVVGWSLWLAAVFFTLLFLKRHIIFWCVLKWKNVKEFDEVLVQNCYLKYDFYDAKQDCHFYDMYVNENGNWWNILTRSWWASVGSTELIHDIGLGMAGDIENLPLEFLKLDVLGVGHLRTIGDEWDD
ncbi:hypothetical protein VPHK469_0078 [Vibrio phage K469]